MAWSSSFPPQNKSSCGLLIPRCHYRRQGSVCHNCQLIKLCHLLGASHYLSPVRMGGFPRTGLCHSYDMPLLTINWQLIYYISLPPPSSFTSFATTDILSVLPENHMFFLPPSPPPPSPFPSRVMNNE